MSPNPTRMCYIGRKHCGCVVAAIVIDPSGPQNVDHWRREVAKTVADWIRHGMTIEMVEVEYARQNFADCQHDAKPSKQQALAL